jgi:hypothetical protein
MTTGAARPRVLIIPTPFGLDPQRISDTSAGTGSARCRNPEERQGDDTHSHRVVVVVNVNSERISS